MRRENIRIARQRIRKLLPKKVTVTVNGFCKYGRVQHGVGSQSQSVMVVPIKGNQNNNWKIG